MFSLQVAAAIGDNAPPGTFHIPSGSKGKERSTATFLGGGGGIQHKKAVSSVFPAVSVCVSMHPNSFHGGIEGHHLSQCVLGLFKLLQQLLVVPVGCMLSLLQLLPALQQMVCIAAGNTHMHTD